jgi:hypothetical protein
VAYLRYVIPMIFCLPFVVFMTFCEEQKGDSYGDKALCSLGTDQCFHDRQL